MKNANKPAMPIRNDVEIGDKPQWVDGLTKREYFAGMAMQALVSDIVNAESKGYEVTAEQTAKEAVAQADALLAELEDSK